MADDQPGMKTRSGKVTRQEIRPPVPRKRKRSAVDIPEALENDEIEPSDQQPAQNSNFPLISWTRTDNNFLQANYTSVRFDGHQFRFQEDSTSRSRPRADRTRLFECIDCRAVTRACRQCQFKKKCAKHSAIGSSARVKISDDYKAFAEDPDWANREHTCIPLITAHPLRSNIKNIIKVKKAVVEPKVPAVELVPVTQKYFDLSTLTDLKVKRLVIKQVINWTSNIQYQKSALHELQPKRPYEVILNWDAVPILRRRYPKQYMSIFFEIYFRDTSPEEICSLVHEHFLKLVTARGQKPCKFSDEFKKWKTVFVDAANKTAPGANKTAYAVTDAQAFDWVPKFMAQGDDQLAAELEKNLPNVLLRIPYRNVLADIKNTHSRPRLVIVGDEHKTTYISTRHQLVRCPKSLTFAEQLAILVEFYVVFEAVPDKVMRPLVTLLHMIYGIDGAFPLDRKFLALFMSTQRTLASASEETNSETSSEMTAFPQSSSASVDGANKENREM